MHIVTDQPGPQADAVSAHPHHREGVPMSLHEELVRVRQQEARRAAREHALVRSVVAGRRWALLARFADGRAERARNRVPPPP